MFAASTRAIACTGFATLVTIGGEAVSEAPEAGSVIENTASVSYFNTVLGLTEVVNTNSVGTIVNAVEDFEISFDQSYERSPGEEAEFLFYVDNTGNVDTEVVLNFGDYEGTYNFSQVQPVLDINGNGIIDSGEPALMQNMVLSLPLGERIGIVVLVDVPENTITGDHALGRLSGVLSSEFNQPSQNIGTLRSPEEAESATGEVIIREAGVDLRKEVIRTDSGALVYSLTFRNNSSTALQPGDLFDGPMQLDGVGEELLLVRDRIPLNTEFTDVIDSVDFDVVYNLFGESEEVWTRIRPEDESQIEYVGFVTDEEVSPGASRDFSFEVTVIGQGRELVIDNTAEVVLPNGAGASTTHNSNQVSTVLSGDSGTVSFHDSDQFGDEISFTGFGDDVFLQVDSGVCNLTAGIDEASITITTSPDGDTETITAIETAPNSGVFQSASLPTSEAPPVIQNDGVLQGSRRSVASATVDCDPDASNDLVLSPAGAVFLSATNEPVPGARVDLIGPDGSVVQTSRTDKDGLFEVVPVTSGGHYIRVTPPQGLVAPSIRTSFSGYGRVIDPSASYGGNFAVASSALGGALNLDIPVDPDFTGALITEKTSDKRTVSIGEVIEYDVDVRNAAPVAVQNTEIVDTLPTGVSFVPGSALLNGESLADPENAAGRQLVFPIETLSPNETVELVYSVVVDPNALEGDATNLAFSSGTFAGFGNLVQSNLASHTVNIDNSAGVFSRSGIVLGKVFLDCNGDGLQQNEDGAEPGVPGVMLHTQSGLSVVTDLDGAYSLQSLRPKTHVIDVYEPTLPVGGALSVTRAMDALSAGSRFVPLRAGEIRTEDFAIEACKPETLKDVLDRIKTSAARAEGVTSEMGSLSLDGNLSTNRNDHHQQADGIIISDLAQNDVVDSAVPIEPAELDLLDLIKEHSGALEFLSLSDGQLLSRRSRTVQVSGPAGAELELVHNGVPVSRDQVGRKLDHEAAQIVEYVALDLSPGENVLSLSATDSFGNVRDELSITVIAPGKAAGINIVAPDQALANAIELVPITLQAVDAEGRLTASSVEVTLIPGDDEFDARDVSDQTPGQQVFLVDGQATIGLIPSGRVGTRTIRVTSSLGDDEIDIQFIADTEQEDIAVGFVEAGLHLNESKQIAGLPSHESLSPLEDTKEGIEANLYLKGELFEDTLLTLRYESDKEIESELFRSDEPDEFYPIYGDRSTRGYDAQSSGKGFALLEHGTSFMMFGDVSYDANASALQLGRYQRSLEGGLAHFEVGNIRLDGYYGKTDTGQVVVEIPALGISGPYDLGFGEVVQNSELVELVTRDREQPDVILSTERLSRFSAYTLDYFARTLVFTRPIASRDEDLNPVSIRVTFETPDGAGEKYDVYGMEGAFDLTEWMTLGARTLISNGPRQTESKRKVRAAYADIAVGESGNLQLEVADTENGEGETGSAARLSFEHSTNSGVYGARISVSDEDFDAPGASINAGREEARLYANRQVGKTSTLNAEAIYSAAKANGTERLGFVGRYETALGDNIRIRAGSRYVTEDRSNGDGEDALTAIAGIVWTPEWLKGGSVDFEVEQELTEGSASRIALGTDYSVTPKWRVYAQGEYSSSRSGEFGLVDSFNQNTTLRAGSEYRFSDNVSAFTEYRANQSVFDAGIAQGLTANWSIGPAVSTRARVEHVQPIGELFPKNTAVGLGFTVEPDQSNWIADADIDFASGESGRQTWYTSTTVGKHWYDITLLARNRFALTKTADGTRTRDRMRVGLAHRPKDDDRVNTLAWYEFALDKQELSSENRHIWSVGGEKKASENLRLRGRVAGQYYSFKGGPASINVDELTMLAQIGGDRDFGKRWNFAGNVSAITDGDFEDQSVGAGVELNYVFKKDATIGLGYNYAGVERESLEGLYRTGLFARMRVKFDQSLWNIFEYEDQ